MSNVYIYFLFDIFLFDETSTKSHITPFVISLLATKRDVVLPLTLINELGWTQIMTFQIFFDEYSRIHVMYNILYKNK